jgi:hypothetical protein
MLHSLIQQIEELDKQKVNILLDLTQDDKNVDIRQNLLHKTNFIKAYLSLSLYSFHESKNSTPGKLVIFTAVLLYYILLYTGVVKITKLKINTTASPISPIAVYYIKFKISEKYWV